MKKALRSYIFLIMTLTVGFGLTGLLYFQSLKQHQEKSLSQFNTESEVFINMFDLIISSQIIRLQNFEENIEEEIGHKVNSSRFINVALRNSVFSALSVFKMVGTDKEESPIFRNQTRYEIPNGSLPPYDLMGSGLESPIANMAVKSLIKTGAKFFPYIGTRNGTSLFVVAWHSTIRPKYFYFASGTPSGLYEKSLTINPNFKVIIHQKLDGSYHLIESAKGNVISLKSISVAEYNTLIEKSSAMKKLIGNYSQNYFEIQGLAQASTVQYDWPIMVLISGVVITLLVSLLIFSLVNRNIEIKKMVDERTADLLVESSKAKEAAYVKTRFLANTSHEIRSPLNIILGMADMLKESGTTTRQSQYVENLQTAGNHLLNLINDILEMARVDSNDVPFKYSQFSMIEFMEQVAKLIYPSIEKKDLQLFLDFDPSLPAEVETDPGRLRQILINLLNNAVKFTDTGFIRLETKVLKTVSQADLSMEIEFRITDTGPGIPEDAKMDIFKAFYQVNPSLTRLKGGVGLGLSIVQAIVDKFGGHIQVQSELRKGSTISVTMPIHATKSLPWVSHFKPTKKDAKILLISSGHAQDSDLMRTLEACKLSAKVLPSLDLQVRSQRDELSRFDYILTSKADIDHIAEIPEIFENIKSKLIELGQPILPKEVLRSLGTVDASATVAEAPEKISPISSLAKPPGLSLLIVDDDPSNRILMQAYLKDQKWKVRYAKSGEEALDLCSEEYPDILITDLQMPTMDGFTLISHIRQLTLKQKEKKNPKFVVLTADALPETAEYAKTTRVDCYLTKPIRKKDLIETVMTI